VRYALAALAAFVLAILPAKAAVIITFYSHHLSSDGLNVNFPHAFFTLTGTTSDGRPVKANYGFTAVSVTPAILWSRVDGEMASTGDGYIAEGKPHLSRVLTDAQYGAVLTVVKAWQTWPQPSYDLDTHNCVTFIKDIAVAAGLSVSNDKKFVRDPDAFLTDVAVRNGPLPGPTTASRSVSLSTVQ
jgi:hypothetical protein